MAFRSSWKPLKASAYRSDTWARKSISSVKERLRSVDAVDGETRKISRWTRCQKALDHQATVGTYSGQIQLMLSFKLVLVRSRVPPDLVLETGTTRTG